MIAYIKGKITHRTRTEVIIEANGIGYFIHITLNTYDKIVALTEATLFTCFLVKEDSHSLYGFAEMDEKAMFEQLISVSGVGASTARVMLSSLSASDLRSAIIAEKTQILRNIKGIGAKSAARIILELKDKLLKDSGAESEAIAASLGGGGVMGENPIREEALSALVALGFNKIQVQKVLNQLLKQNNSLSDSGDLIKLALGQL
jgi:Holliday junction DNA helicase RuvA